MLAAAGAQKEAPTILSGSIQVHGEGIKGRVNPAHSCDPLGAGLAVLGGLLGAGLAR